MLKIRPRERDAIVQALRSGMVPRIGQQHVQVGRKDEVAAFVRDVETISDGGASARFVIGEYGSGKTFFIHLVRQIALDKRLVTAHADLNPDRRLHASAGQAQGLYSELVKNLATKTSPEGGALAGIVERFITVSRRAAAEQKVEVEQIIRSKLASLEALTGGYDFASVIASYCRADEVEDGELKSAALRWLRGEYATKTDARSALGVRTIVEDNNVYDHLKLLSRFVCFAGYGGLLVCLDEMVNLYKLQNPQARASNYEQLLRILNDCLSGSAEHIGFVFGGTPEFLLDPRRGVYSYEALRSRLQENSFVTDALTDYTGPIIRLASLTQEDFYVLLARLRHVWARGDEQAYLIDDEAIEAFMRHSLDNVGEAYFRTPRQTIKRFLDLLSILDQHPGIQWQTVLGSVPIAVDAEGQSDAEKLEESDKRSSNLPSDEEDDDLTRFVL